MAKQNNGANLGFEGELWKAADVLRSNMDAAKQESTIFVAGKLAGKLV